MTLSLETLMLDQLAGLTDDDYSDVYLDTCIVTMANIDTPPRDACNAHSPVSMLVDLPKLVKAWTGLDFKWNIGDFDGIEVYLPAPMPGLDDASHEDQCAKRERLGHYLIRQWSDCKPRHLVHACLWAAFAACIVFGRKE